MDTPEFPPNSETSKRSSKDGKRIERVISGEATRRKKSLRKQFSETFIAGDAKTAVSYGIFEVMLPAARDMIWEAFSEGLRSLIFGDSRRRRGGGSTPPPSGPYGHVAYNRYSTGSQSGPSRAMSRVARSRHNFDEIILEERAEAEQVIDQLFDVVSRYEAASVADLYELVGLNSSHTDHKWGWTDLHGAGVSRIRGGYLLDLPEPVPLD